MGERGDGLERIFQHRAARIARSRRAAYVGYFGSALALGSVLAAALVIVARYFAGLHTGFALVACVALAIIVSAICAPLVLALRTHDNVLGATARHGSLTMRSFVTIIGNARPDL